MDEILKKLDLTDEQPGAGTGTWLGCEDGQRIESVSPTNGEVIGSIRCAGPKDYDTVVSRALDAFGEGRGVGLLLEDGACDRRSVLQDEEPDAIRFFDVGLGCNDGSMKVRAVSLRGDARETRTDVAGVPLNRMAAKALRGRARSARD